MMDPRERLIVALDVPEAATAGNLVAALGESVCTYKVGMRLFTAAGPQFVRELSGTGRKVFLDLKFHDIPNTVASAIKLAAGLGVSMLTVHAAGGSRMLREAVHAAHTSNSALKVLAVTVLTSMSESDLPPLGVRDSILDQVMRLASLSAAEGCDGVISSAREAGALRQEFGTDFLIVTPGVRLAGGEPGDQSRVVTPKEAILAGASHIVVGRPILAAADPLLVVREIVGQISNAVSPVNYSFS